MLVFIQFADGLKWLHLGYNKLICVPQFGDRAMYNLTVLILRNNSLSDIEGYYLRWVEREMLIYCGMLF